MTLPKVIVVATDFSDAAEAALDYAIGIATVLGAQVHLLHTYQLPIVGFPDGTWLPSAEIASRIIALAKEGLDGAVAKHAHRGVTILPTLKQADPRDGVLSLAEEIDADLVVIGTHGRSGIARALIGSVAESIVRTSRVPVLTVHAAA